MLSPSILLRKVRSLVGWVVRRTLFQAFERVVPAQDHYWCFCTWDRYAHTLDNPRAVFEAVKNDPSITKIILRKTSGHETPKDGVKVEFVLAESLRGAYCLARSRVVLMGYASHGMTSYSSGLTSKHLIVQLWHGIPLRRVGKLFPRETWWESETPKYAAMVASTEQDRGNLSQAFAPIPRDRIWVTGLPRNDFLLAEEHELPADYRGHLEELRCALRGRRLVLYAPTWRDSERDLYVFSQADRAQLELVLRRHHAVLGIRGHSNVRDFKGYAEDYASSEILSLNQVPDVNVVLRDTAVLVTDYSSIYIDFLLTNRPIIHFAYDFEAYARDRGGFLYDLDRAFAGPVARCFDELLRHLDEALTVGVTDHVRHAKAKELFHAHGSRAGSAVAERIRQLVAVGSR